MSVQRPVTAGAIYLGVGIGVYDDAGYPALPKAVNETSELAQVLADFGYETHLLADPGRVEAIELDRLLAKDLLVRGDGKLIVLWSGHGEPAPEDKLILVVKDTTPGSAPLITADLLAGIAARTGASQILLVLDTCYSGAGTIDGAAVADRVLQELPPAAERVWFGVLSSTLDAERARDGLFGERLLRLLRQGPEDPELRLRWSAHSVGVRGDDVIDALLKEWDSDLQQPKAATVGNAWVMLPNPRHDPAAGPRVVEHLLLAARGIDPGEGGFYFTGRTGQLDRVVGWLQTGRPGVLVVTGPAGSGKSAIVGRTVSLSDPEERAQLLEQGPIGHADPGEGSIAAHVHARRLTAERLVEVLDEQLVAAGVLSLRPAGRRNRGQLQGDLEQSDSCPTIAIDGLDEAGTEAWRIAEDVIRLLAGTARVLVGTRNPPHPSGEHSLVETLLPTETIDLGNTDLQAPTAVDVREYVAKRLAGIGEPQMDAAKIGDEVVQLAREQGEGLFLLARVITAQLRREPINTSTPEWEGQLAHSVTAAFARDLDRIPYRRRESQELPHAARELLAALAWGYGAGLPDDVWPVIATALSLTRTDYDREDVFWLLGQAGRYIVEDGEGGRAVYRLSHQRLADYLRQWTPTGSDTTSAEGPATDERAARVASALVAYYEELLIAGLNPTEPTYLWRYTWRHCADAGWTGIDALRQLVARDNKSLLPDLAAGLRDLGNRYSEVGRREDAVAPSEEAVRLYQDLAGSNPAFLPDLAGALNNLGIRYSQVGRRQDAVAPSEEAVRLRREQAASNPAFLPNLAMALSNLGSRYSEVGRGSAIRTWWEETIGAMADPRSKAYLLLRQAESGDVVDPSMTDELLAAKTLITEDDRDLIAHLHAVCRARRAQNPQAFDKRWPRESGVLPAWLLLSQEDLDLTWNWITTSPVTADKEFFAGHQDRLLATETDVALDEIALQQVDPSVIEPYRQLLEQARQVGIDAAYRPRLALELLETWLDTSLDAKQSMLNEQQTRAELLGDDVANALGQLRDNYPDHSSLIVHEALLALSRAGHEQKAFEALADPDRFPALLADLARANALSALHAMATLAIAVDASAAVHASGSFYRAITLASANNPQDAVDEVRHARQLDPSQVTMWLGLLVELAPQHPDVIQLTRALLETEQPEAGP
jgi:tetratricopeptide (TPR) repeat protein